MASAHRMHLNAFIMTTGHHITSWRQPTSAARASYDVDHYVREAQAAERGKFDAVFFGDALDTGPNIRFGAPHALDPLALIPAIAVQTDRIGLVGTVSASFQDPFTSARRLSSIDHISRGRAGWNVVTSARDSEARNFGRDDHYSYEERYERATEFAQVTSQLWDSWEDAAFVEDKATGVFVDTDKVHPVNHVGTHFKVAGPLNVAPGPQRKPVFFQAGTTGPGRLFAAKFAEAIFTSQNHFEAAKTFYIEQKSLVAAQGRDGNGVKILPGLAPVIGSTTSEARRIVDDLQEHGGLEVAIDHLSSLFGLNLREYDLDGPVPTLDDPESLTGLRSRYELFADIAERENPTLRELLAIYAVSRGLRAVIGTPEMIADEMEKWFTQGAADGFNIMPPIHPGMLDVFVDEVVPILQKRGLFRKDYTASTLRGHLSE